jgi:cobalt/nickel transport system permease protein
MVSESFAEGRSFLHCCDPRVKIIIALVFALIVAATRTIAPLIIGIFFIIVCLILVSIRPVMLIKRLAIVNIFVLFLALMLPFTTSGAVLFSYGPLTMTEEGIILAGLIVVKSNLIVLSSIFLLSTSSVFILAHALHHLRIPTKLIHLLVFTFRYFDVLSKEYSKLINALKLRCFKARTNFTTYRTIAYLVGNLLIKSHDRSERIYQAMLCRGFTGNFPAYIHFKLTKKDIFFSLFSGLFLLSMAIASFIMS